VNVIPFWERQRPSGVNAAAFAGGGAVVDGGRRQPVKATRPGRRAASAIAAAARTPTEVEDGEIDGCIRRWCALSDRSAIEVSDRHEILYRVLRITACFLLGMMRLHP
jgi:hypothetical protein